MGKRSNFERAPQDKYDTPYEAIPPLLPFLPPGTLFDEPCAGKGNLVRHLESHGHSCVYQSDIEPGLETIHKIDVFKRTNCKGHVFLTNPPWKRDILHPLISHLIGLAPTFLLFDAEWAHTKQSSPFMPYCRAIISVGRLRWIPGTKMTGKESCAWYVFDRFLSGQTTLFYGRGKINHE